MSAESLQDVMKRRNLNQQDLLAAAKTYVPTGKRDEFLAFSSGGQSGQVLVYGIPSMRILKYIGVFTPEPWQGYGYDEEEGRRLWLQTRAALRAKYPAAACEVGLLQIGCTIAVHTGPYALGMGVMRRWKKQQ